MRFVAIEWLNKAFSKVTTLGLFFSGALGSPTNAAQLKALFNHDSNRSYVEPYRHLNRNGDDLEAALISNIDSAQKSLWIAVQEIRLPLIAKAIAKKMREGVDVRMVIENSYNYDLRHLRDSQGSQEEGFHAARNQEYLKFTDTNGDGVVSEAEALDRDAIYILKNAKVPLIDDTADGSAGSGLMHHKFLIVDGKKVVVTSANFTMSDIHGDYSNLKTRGNANSLIEFDDSKLAQIFSEEFLILWGTPNQKPRFGVKKPYRPAQTVVLDSGERVTVQFSGTSKKLGVDESTLGLILRSLKGASHKIDMALFVFSEADFSQALHTLHDQSSIEIRALVEPTFAYRYYSKTLDMWGLQLLPQNCRAAPGSEPWSNPVQTVGVPSVPKGDFLHHKFAVIDSKTTIMGSHNWSRAAADHNDETLMVVDSPALAEAYDGEFSMWYQDAHLGAPAWLVKDAEQSQARCH